MTDYVPLSQMRTVAWISCARCSGDLFIPPESIASLAEGGYSAARSLPGEGPWIYCRTCKPLADAEEARHPVAQGARCVLARYQRGPFSDLFIVKVESAGYTVTLDGAEYPVSRPPMITVGVLGFGQAEPERLRRMLSNWWPAGLWDRDPLVFSRAELVMKGH
jgi:hypothetical protein